MPLVADHEPIPRVEHGPAVFRGEIKRVLRQVILARDALRSRAGDVERRNVVKGLRISVRSKERQPMAETLLQTRLQCVVTGIRDARDQSHRRKIAGRAGG